MIDLLLLVIIAILLFGAAAVRSVAGMAIAGAVAVVFLLYLLSTGWAGVALFALVVLGIVAIIMVSAFAKARAGSAAVEARTRRILAMTDDEREIDLDRRLAKQKDDDWQRQYIAARKAGPLKKKRK